MLRRLSILILIASFLLACSEEKRRFLRPGKTYTKDFVLEMQHFFSDSEDNVSFPVWFNDSLIRENNVKSIHRKMYNLNGDPDDFASIKTEKHYEFDKNGAISKLQIDEYYEGQKVSDVTFSYLNVKDVHGFHRVKMTKVNEFNDDLTAYQMYDVEQTASSFLAYEHRDNGNYLFFLPHEKYWGTLSVDSILSPTTEDIIVFGTPKKPVKRYRVVNRVKEFDVKTIEYSLKGNHPLEIKYEQEPFNYKRNIQYDKSGLCTGFIDSTFSLDRFINRRNSTFSFNENNQLPERITHTNEQRSNNDPNIQIETFEYTYYE
ncbi:MAG: hypothetical protein HWE22_11765 [Flavobacteriales bacterium]|nr:hypothetical protein [Flavobacteriales bacterium]